MKVKVMLTPGTGRKCERRCWTIRRRREDKQVGEKGNLGVVDALFKILLRMRIKFSREKM